MVVDFLRTNVTQKSEVANIFLPQAILLFCIYKLTTPQADDMGMFGIFVLTKRFVL